MGSRNEHVGYFYVCCWQVQCVANGRKGRAGFDEEEGKVSVKALISQGKRGGISYYILVSPDTSIHS